MLRLIIVLLGLKLVEVSGRLLRAAMHSIFHEALKLVVVARVLIHKASHFDPFIEDVEGAPDGAFQFAFSHVCNRRLGESCEYILRFVLPLPNALCGYLKESFGFLYANNFATLI